MARNLFLCNTVYQVLVAMWIKHSCVTDTPADIVISDHMNNGKDICQRMKINPEFENCYYVESLHYARWREKTSRVNAIVANLIPNRRLRDYLTLEKDYSGIFLANVDRFSCLLFEAVQRRNHKVQVHIFEDGGATYTNLFREYLETTKKVQCDVFHEAVRRYIYRKKYLHDYAHELYLFHPANIKWHFEGKCLEIPKIDCDDLKFRNICNWVFRYDDICDSYDRKYIFMEESYFVEGLKINDVELVEQIAARVGKENIMIKIHPRNPVNRFKQAGFKTNENMSIPWELIVMNTGDISDKILITIASSSVMTPILLFGKKVHVYSLYNLINEDVKKSKLLSGGVWEYTKELFEKYNNMITVCNSVDEIGDCREGQ